MNTGPKSYVVKSPGIGYDKNVDAVSECLRTRCERTLACPGVARRALAQIIWAKVSPSGLDGMIRFDDDDVISARDHLVDVLGKV